MGNTNVRFLFKLLHVFTLRQRNLRRVAACPILFRVPYCNQLSEIAIVVYFCWFLMPNFLTFFRARGDSSFFSSFLLVGTLALFFCFKGSFARYLKTRASFRVILRIYLRVCTQSPLSAYSPNLILNQRSGFIFLIYRRAYQKPEVG